MILYAELTLGISIQPGNSAWLIENGEGLMNRLHVRLMHEQSGYQKAMQVLRARKARPDFAVYLEMLEKGRLQELRRKAAETEPTHNGGNHVPSTAQAAQLRCAGARRPPVSLPRGPR